MCFSGEPKEKEDKKKNTTGAVSSKSQDEPNKQLLELKGCDSSFAIPETFDIAVAKSGAHLDVIVILQMTNWVTVSTLI